MVTGRTSPEIEAARDKIDRYRKEGCAIINYCNLSHIPDFHKIDVIPIKIPASDIYKPSQSKGFTLHYRALVMLGNEIGVQWLSDETKMTLVPGQYVQYDAVGFYRRSDGEPVLASGLGVRIYTDEKEALLAGFMSKARSQDKGKEWAEHKAQDAFFNDRKKYPQKAEAEAKAQVLRNLLRLSGAYAKEMFDKPIILVRCRFVPDYSDPGTVRLMQLSSIEASNSIYGPSTSTQALLPQPGGMPENAEVRTPDADAEIPRGMDLTGEGGEKEESDRDVFISSDVEAQASWLTELVVKKAYQFQEKEDGGRHTFEEVSLGQYLQFYDMLVEMPDDSDDIPF